MSALVPYEQPPVEPVAPGYYTARQDHKDFPKGSTAYALGLTEDGRVEVVRGERHWYFGRESFDATFEADPLGLTKRQAEIGKIMEEAAALQAEGSAAERLLREFSPHITEEGDLSSTALVAAGGSNPAAAKRQIAEMRNMASKLRSELKERQTAIEAFAKEQALILGKQAKELQALVEIAQEAVWTINLYLGGPEQIVRLSEGEPAPANTPIHVRQLVLYMDEECALAAEDGGIDATKVDDFDEWLLDPANLQQVLPEQKGMVALKPRRKARTYDDPWVAKIMGGANKKTYFLLRNGENLYRLTTDYEVGDTLVPRTKDFTETFTDRQWNWETHEYETITLKPGSDAFMRAEKQAQGQRRHYMRAALILQGLIDRTTIFRPLAWEAVNVGNEATYAKGGPIKVILDDDVMLSDGRERFWAWFKRINSTLDIGMRIIGNFGNYEHGLPSMKRYSETREPGHPRLSPRQAEYPSDDAIYTIEGRRGGGFFFYYPRKERNWNVPYWQADTTYKRRASCVVESHDEFFLCFDSATVEEMEFYLTSRLDRHEYTYLVPILRKAIKLKQAEARAEEPFLDLLAGQISKGHRVDVEDVRQELPELVSWYKFKNRTHRALAADDALALREIVKEYGLRQKKARTRTKATMDAVKRMILAKSPDAILIAHKAGNEYVALVPANDENVFIHEQVWAGGAFIKETREWRVVDNRWQRWHVLYTSPAWETWKRPAFRSEHLSDPEREQLTELGWKALREQHEWRRRNWASYNGRPDVPLAVTYKEGKVHLWWDDGDSEYRPGEPVMGHATPGWKRGPGGELEITQLNGGNQSYESYNRIRWPWEAEWGGSYGKDIPYRGRVVWTDPEAMEQFRQRWVKHESEVATRRKLDARRQELFERFRDAFVQRAEDEARAKFAADFGDPDLWEGHLKTLNLPQRLDADGLSAAIKDLVEADRWKGGEPTAADVIRWATKLTGKEYALDPSHADLRAIEPDKADEADDDEEEWEDDDD